MELDLDLGNMSVIWSDVIVDNKNHYRYYLYYR